MDNIYKYLYTFIIPHQNNIDLLDRCLNSIPTRDDIQIIIIDDNSDPDKKPFINRLNVEIIYLNQEESKGAGHARNVGLKKAKGKWLLFADCDDFYVDGFIYELDKYKDRELDVLYYNYNFIDGKSNTLLPKLNIQKIITDFNGSKYETDYIKYFNHTPWSKMVSHEYVLKHNMYFEEVINGNDILFSLFIASYTNKIEINNKCIYNYVRNNNSITFKTSSNDDIICRITHIIKKKYFLKEIGYSKFNSIIPIMHIVYKCELKQKIHVTLTILKRLTDILKNRKEWIDIVNEHR